MKSVEKFWLNMLDRGSPDVCTNIVKRELKRLDWIFQQDNDPKHMAGHTWQWLRDQTVTVLDWPSYIPDLNSTESVLE